MQLRHSAASSVKTAGVEAGLSLKADQYVVDQRLLRFAKEVERKLEAKAEKGYVDVRLASKSTLADIRALTLRVNSFHDLLELKGRDMFIGRCCGSRGGRGGEGRREGDREGAR